MERLTIKYDEGYVPRGLCTIDREGVADDCDLCCEYCQATKEGYEDCSECAISQCFEKLGAYEDLEEHGKLLKLPCKAGQKVYLLRKDIKAVIDGEITSIRIGEFASDMKIFIIEDNRYTDSSFDKIGDIVFFTREEAEAALKELES